MKITFDPKYNVGYIALHEKIAEVETVRAGKDVNVDIAPDGTVYGIELLNANEQSRAEVGGKLVVVVEAAGESAEIRLAV